MLDVRRSVRVHSDETSEELAVAFSSLGNIADTEATQNEVDEFHNKSAEGGPGGTKNILVIVDLQNDYFHEQDHPLENPGITEVGKYIAELKSQGPDKVTDKPWDAIVYTYDWLEPNDIFPYAIRGTDGAENPPQLAPLFNEVNKGVYHSRVRNSSSGIPLLRCTKSSDDVWNLLNTTVQTFSGGGMTVQSSAPDWVVLGGVPKFSIDADFEGVPHAPLLIRLAELGFEPTSKTRLVITGTLLTRCVLKSAIHAKALGYKVKVDLKGSTGEDNSKANGMWTIKPYDQCEESKTINGCTYDRGQVPPPFCVGNQGKDRCDKDELNAWRMAVYSGQHGGPHREDAPAYLRAAGVKVVHCVPKYGPMQKTIC